MHGMKIRLYILEDKECDREKENTYHSFISPESSLRLYRICEWNDLWQCCLVGAQLFNSGILMAIK